MSPRSKGLLEALQALAEQHGGAIPFREFMRFALFHPEFGYYIGTVRDVGGRGDFSTLPTLGPHLASCVFDWAQAVRQSDPRLKNAPFLEVGAGGGQFAREYLRCGGLKARVHANYWIVEAGDGLRNKQKERLRGWRVRWFEDIPSAIRAASGKLLIFSNELVDAFPCSVWEWTGTEWLEVCLQIGKEGVMESLRPGNPPTSTNFAWPSPPAKGQRVETHESYDSWLAGWSPMLRLARMLTVDYGGSAQQIYTRRPTGTLRAYWNQQRMEGAAVYARCGQQDLTADVCFTDLEDWMRQRGWKVLQNTGLSRAFPKLQTVQEGAAQNFFALEAGFPAET